ncbi:MAG: hypothetical protein MJ123_03790 [Lachnospiraceae bacterium]|nr:hypothetical protein [Lachnospiraceae bacterium]
MKNSRIIAALIGLTGAVSNNGKTENTDDVVLKALTMDDGDEIVNEIHDEKFRISPNCATCESPCGNTSDYDMDKFFNGPEDVVKLKLEIVDRVKEYALKCSKDMDDLEVIYKALAYLGYDLKYESYMALKDEL